MSIYAPAFEARMRARQAAGAGFVPDVARGPAPEPLTVAFRGLAADGLRRIAAARHESPQVLAAAIVEQALRNGSAEEALGDARAETLTGGQGRRPFEGAGALTMRQCAVIYLIGNHGGVTGWCGWSASALAQLMPGGSVQTVLDILPVLARRGLIERGPQVGRMPRPSRLTELGRAVHAELSGDVAE